MKRLNIRIFFTSFILFTLIWSVHANDNSFIIEKLNSINSRLDNIDNSLNNINNRLDNIEKRIDAGQNNPKENMLC
ncbi:secreted protein [Candidatus Magnetomorum sp. HK-1]|nr:secreted protein [Candidatus Magnetomorum sp. HK-1]